MRNTDWEMEGKQEKRNDLKIIIVSWPDRFGFPIFKSADWEMRERQKRNGGWGHGVCEETKKQTNKGTDEEKTNKREKQQYDVRFYVWSVAFTAAQKLLKHFERFSLS